MMKRLILIVAGMCLLVTGCGARMSSAQLERVAKDWALMVRASQVIPVYPLSEDLQPGDVFLVTVTQHDETREYEKRGFLPLDHLVTRLQTRREYEEFYADAYLEGYADGTPRSRGSRENDRDRFLAPIPAASFPSYTFDVRQGEGIRIALPVQGVPIGLGMLDARTATGSLIIRDAFTYALPGDVLLGRLLAYSQRPEVRGELSRLSESVGDNSIFLRVVNRVYLVGGVDITLTAARARTVGVDTGASQPINLFLDSGEQIEGFENNVKRMNKVLEAAEGRMAEIRIDEKGNVVPGGSVRVARTTNRQVHLEEDFERLLAIGYLGFDVEILDGGELGPPVSTFYKLRGQARALQRVALPQRSQLWNHFTYDAIYQTLRFADDARSRQLVKELDELASHLPPNYRIRTFDITEFGHPASDDEQREAIRAEVSREKGAIVSAMSFSDVVTYWQRLVSSERVLHRAIEAGAEINIPPEFTTDELERIPVEKVERIHACTKVLLQRFEQRLLQKPALRDAIDHWYHLNTGRSP